MKSCYVCGSLLNDKNRALEHIILNACGGRLKSKDLMCQSCNSELGGDADSVLASQLNPMANILNINRERGRPQPIVATHCDSGVEYWMQAGGKPFLKKPIIQEEKVGDKLRLSCIVKDKKQLAEVLSGYKRKYPGIEGQIDKATSENLGSNFKREMRTIIEVGGDSSFRSICKTAINYYILKGGDPAYINHLIPYIKGLKDMDCVYHFPADEVLNLCGLGDVFHVIYIEGDSSSGLLYCYVEFFSCFGFYVLLNEDYRGERFSYLYCFDVLDISEKKKCLPSLLNKEKLKFIRESDHQLNLDNVLYRLRRFQKISLNRWHDDYLQERLNYISSEIIKRFPEGTWVDEYVQEEIISIIVEAIFPYVMNFMED